MTRKQMRRFVGKYAYGIYPHGAISCCWNGVMVRREGRVERIGKTSIGKVGLVIDDRVFDPDEVKCPTLHWEGEKYKARSQPVRG